MAGGPGPGVVDDNQEGQISVYEAPSMELLDRKSIRAEGKSRVGGCGCAFFLGAGYAWFCLQSFGCV
jgi:hypothetical protein